MALREYSPKQKIMFWLPPQDTLPEDHLCFVVDEIVEQLDLSYIPDKSGTVGAPAYDSRLLIKVLFYGYATGTFSSRGLMKAVRENLAYTFLTRQQFPDFRTISDFRKDNLPAIKDIFIQIVRVSREMGMVKLGRVAIDGTKLKANANKEKTYTEDELKKEIEEIENALREGIEIDCEEDKKYGGNNSGEEMPGHLRRSYQRAEKLKSAINELKSKGTRRINLTDPDSKCMHEGKYEMDYNCQASVDDEKGIIISADVTTSPADQTQLKPQVEQIEVNTGKLPEKLVADAGYHSVNNLSYLEEKSIDGYIPDADQARAKKRKYKGKGQLFHKNKFRYIKEEDVYLCPQGKELTRWLYHKQQRLTIYRGEGCKVCISRGLCTRSKCGIRLISRHDNEEILERMRIKMESEEGKGEYRKRGMTIEPLFGHFKENLKFRQFYCRGRLKVLGEFLLLCIGYNIKKIAIIEKRRASYPEGTEGRGTIEQNKLSRSSISKSLIAQFKSFFLIRFFYLRELEQLSPGFGGFY
jgi:transposase